MPNITGAFYACKGDLSGSNTTQGAFTYTGESLYRGRDGNEFYDYRFTFAASKSNEIYGKSEKVTPANITLIAQIKY